MMSYLKTPQQALQRKASDLQGYGDLSTAAQPYTTALAMACNHLDEIERDHSLYFVALDARALERFAQAEHTYEQAVESKGDVISALVDVYEAAKALGLPS